MVQFDTTIHQVFASKAKYFRLEGPWSDEYISKKFEDYQPPFFGTSTYV